MDKPKADKGKAVRKAVKLDSLRGYLDRYKQELKDISMTKKYSNKKLKKQLNAKSRDLRAKIRLIKDIENNFTFDISFEVLGYYEKYGFEGVVAVLERHDIFPKYNFLTVNSILDYVDWKINNKF